MTSCQNRADPEVQKQAIRRVNCVHGAEGTGTMLTRGVNLQITLRQRTPAQWLSGVGSKCKLGNGDRWIPHCLQTFPERHGRGDDLRHCALEVGSFCLFSWLALSCYPPLCSPHDVSHRFLRCHPNSRVLSLCRPLINLLQCILLTEI